MSRERKRGAAPPDTDLRTHLNSIGVIKTPPEIFALLENAVIKAGSLEGASGYSCIYHKERDLVRVNLGVVKEVPPDQDLMVVWRGKTATFEYKPSFSKSKEVEDEGVEVTVLGYTEKAKPTLRLTTFWAFIDFTWKK